MLEENKAEIEEIKMEIPEIKTEENSESGGHRHHHGSHHRSHHGHHKHRHHRRKKRKILRWIKRIFITIFIIILLGVSAFAALHYMGKKKMQTEVSDDMDVVTYQGKQYKYNEDMINILFMGIDTMDTVTDKETMKIYGAGQADSIFWLAFDPRSKKASLINISRDSIVEVDHYDVDGNYQGIVSEQLCLSYAYGNGTHNSCKNTVKSASRLMYELPVSAYLSLNLSGIAALTDQVGGVPVSVLEDLTFIDPEWSQGAQVTLVGDKARAYVQHRDSESPDIATNNPRMARQQQFVRSFVGRVLEKTKSDYGFPLELFRCATAYTVTDIDASRFSYLATQAIGCDLNSLELYTVPGEVIDKNGHAQFIVDDEGLFDIVINVFYNEL